MYSLLAVGAFVGAAAAWGNSSASYSTGAKYTVTETVQTYTTFCPSATQIVQGNMTYTATAVSTDA